jgi:hypothetical protein
VSKIYDIKLCGTNDIGKVRHFINMHWKKNHVLAVSRSLLDFQHYEAQSDTYNFVIARNTVTDEVDGLIGFIPTSHYDKTLSSEKDYWGAIWKIREDVQNEEIKTLGLYLFEKFNEITTYHTFGAIGISEIAKKLYKALRYKTGVLNQFYIYNESINEFKIALRGKVEGKSPVPKNSPCNLRRINDLAGIEELECFYNPKKSLTYLINRYQKHPVYRYNFLVLYENNQLKTILVIRIIEVNNARVIRIVDLLGTYEFLPGIYHQLQLILVAEDAEYIDCVNFGIPEYVFLNAGFTKLDVCGTTIIPTYFEPFEKRNVEIEFAYKSAKPYMIFKGDSDQDRPNIL